MVFSSSVFAIPSLEMVRIHFLHLFRIQIKTISTRLVRRSGYTYRHSHNDSVNGGDFKLLDTLQRKHIPVKV